MGCRSLKELEQDFATQLLPARYFDFDLVTDMNLHRQKQWRKEKCGKCNVCVDTTAINKCFPTYHKQRVSMALSVDILA